MKRSIAIRKATVLTLALLASTAAPAQEPRGPADFAYGWDVERVGDSDYVEITLPLEVYRSSLNGALRDVAVFNADGAPVPRFVYQPEIEQRRAARRRRLPVLPLWGEADTAGGGLSLKILRDAASEIIELDAHASKGAATGDALSGYIVDARGLGGETPQRLSFDWDATSETFLGQVTIEAGDDLTSWRPAGNGAIVELRQGQESLTRRDVAVAPGDADFYRISWTGLPEAWRLTGVEASIAAVTARRIERRELRLEASPPSPDLPGDTRIFDAQATLWVDAVQVTLGTDNGVARARVFSRDGSEGPWQPRFDGVVFRLRNAGDAVQSDPVAIEPVRARQWKVVLTGAAPQEEVGLRLTWRPDRLGFVAQGRGPYRVVAGSDAERRDGFPLHRRFEDPALRRFWTGENRPAGVAGTATLGDRIALAGAAALAPPPAPLPWRTWLLWGALAGGVLLVAWMALSLGRQLRTTDRGDR